MTFLKKHYIALLLGFAVPSFAMAAGLGRMTVQSALGQPLRAEIEVVALQPGEAFVGPGPLQVGMAVGGAWGPVNRGGGAQGQAEDQGRQKGGGAAHGVRLRRRR